MFKYYILYYHSMKQLNITFEDSEMKALKKLKGDLTWRSFILLMYNNCIKLIKNGETLGDAKI